MSRAMALVRGSVVREARFPAVLERLMDEVRNWDLHEPSEKGFTLLHEACDRSQKDPSMQDVIAALSQYLGEADVNRPTTGTRAPGWTALHILANNGDRANIRWRLMERLVEMRANVDAEAENGRTPLLAACATSHFDAIKTLLRLRADVGAKLDGVTTALDLCWNNRECGDLIESAGGLKGKGVTGKGRHSMR